MFRAYFIEAPTLPTKTRSRLLPPGRASIGEGVAAYLASDADRELIATRGCRRPQAASAECRFSLHRKVGVSGAQDPGRVTLAMEQGWPRI